MENKILISVVLGNLIGTNGVNIIETILVSETPHVNSELYIEGVCYKVNRVVRSFRKVFAFTDNDGKTIYKTNKEEVDIYVFVSEYMVNVFQ